MESHNGFPLISVIIPTYGGGEYLSRTINSVLNQDYPQVEIIVVDDNGLYSDNQITTKKRIENFIVSKQIHYVCHDVNKNGSAARNTGVKNCKGAFIAFIDDDDEYFPNTLSSLYSAFEDLPSNYGIVYCGRVKYLGEEKVAETHALLNGNILFDYLMRNIEIGSPGFLIRKTTYEEMGGFDESFSRHQDWEFLTRVLSKYHAQNVDIIGYKVHIYQRNSPSNPVQAKINRDYFLKKIDPYLNNLTNYQKNQIISINKLDIAIQFLKTGSLLSFFKEFVESKSGFNGIRFVCKRVFNVIKHGQIKAKE